MRFPLVASLIVCASVVTAAQQSGSVDKAFDAYWNADGEGSAAKAADRVIKAGIDFETAWTKLKAGRPYKKERTGDISWRYPGPQGAVFDNVVEVPPDYDPSHPTQVRVQLHGGVNRPAQRVGDGVSLDDDEGGGGDAPATGRGGALNLGRRRPPNRIPGETQIYVFPSGWAEAEWWHTNQIDNILRLLDRLKRHYNVDESRVYLTGISDGGTGAYYMAMRETTPWASFLPLNGSIKVLANPDIKVDGELAVSNLTNKPLYIVNGGRDPLYPVEHVQTHVEALKRLGVSLVFSPQPAAGHDTSWWRWERVPYEQFVRSHPRQPHPPKLSWETERVDRFNRAHWLVIDRLGSGASDTAFADSEIFSRRKPSGRVDVERRGNTVQAHTRGVREFTLLISPDAFDLAQPITVMVNDKQAFRDIVKNDVATLFKWAARDNDRTMLYAAELTIAVP
jgi:pimeloyl-ACP methyl ester carboxylesterase